MSARPIAARLASALRLAAVAAAGLGLTGCISLFPKSNPAQLYRFGTEVAAPAGAPQTAARIGLHVYTTFDRASEGDRILTATGNETAYIAGSRWVSPASVLFDEAMQRAFEGQGSPFRLLRPGDMAPDTLKLMLVVESFEADYGEGGKGAPTVVVRIRAAIDRARSPTAAPAPIQVFEARVPASDNRVGAIVQAYDAATSQALSQLLTWSAAQAPQISSSGS